jgi:hypothetical protein
MVLAIIVLVRWSNAAGYELETLPLCYSGSVGISLYSAWYEPFDSSVESQQAAERELQFQVSFQTNFCNHFKMEPYTLHIAWIS